MNDFERKEYKNLLSDYIKASERILELEKENKYIRARYEELEKENKKLKFEKKALQTGIDLDMTAKLLSKNKKLKKAIKILKKYINVSWLTDTLYSDKDRYGIEVTHKLRNLAVIEIPYNQYELLKEVLDK